VVAGHELAYGLKIQSLRPRQPVRIVCGRAAQALGSGPRLIREDLMRSTLRAIGYVVLASAAVGAYFGLAPKVVTDMPTLPSASQYESLILQALSDDTANNARALGAPQQSVVNGWTARDLLTIIAKEQADILRAQGAVVDATGRLQTNPFDERIPALLLIVLLALAWNGLTAAQPQLVTTMSTRTTEPLTA
jgi:hypothetical protein